MNSRVPIKHLFGVSRRMVMPSDFGTDPLFHYSLPAWHEHGDGIVENAADLASGKLLLDGGEILVSKLNPEKSAVLLAESHEIPTVCSPEFIALEPRAIKRRFAYYFMLSAPLRHQLNASVESVTNSHKRARVDRFLASKVELPDPDTQKTISDFLDRETDRINQLIEKRSRFAQLVLERRLAITSQAVTGTTDDMPWLSGLREGWKAERAKVHFRESQKRSETGDEELLTVSHITGVTKRSEKDVNMFMAESNEGYKLVAPGDLVINTMWAWMGAMGVSSDHGLISPSYGIYTPISQELQPGFVDLMVRSKPFIAEATRRSKGIHSSRLRLYPDAFLDMRLPIPSLEVQDQLLEDIAQRAKRENALLEKNNQAETLLQELRSALITAAVTGQIDVTTWGKQGQTDRRLDQIEEDMALREARA